MKILVGLVWMFVLVTTIFACGSKEDGGVAGKDYTFTTSSISMISTSQYHSCALTSLGPMCWGGNWKGQLGDGTIASTNQPIAATQFNENISAIEVGQATTCAIDNGAVLCVGDNEYGQLGTDAIDSVYSANCLTNDCFATTATAVKAVGGTGSLTGVSSISLGGWFGCGVTTAGGAVCWGFNGSGQLGNGSFVNATSAVQVSGLTANVTQVETGYDHACAIVSGGVQCWGDNLDGQLGDAGACGFSCNSPQAVTGLGAGSGVVDLALGDDFSCALLDTGAVQCWGDNAQAIIDITTLDKNVPTATSLTTGGANIEAGLRNMCAVLTTGEAQCWGDVSVGILGDGGTTTADTATPTQVSGLTNVSRLSINNSNTACAVQNGELYCWGFGSYGNLGNGTNKYIAISPVKALVLSE